MVFEFTFFFLFIVRLLLNVWSGNFFLVACVCICVFVSLTASLYAYLGTGIKVFTDSNKISSLFPSLISLVSYR